MVFELIKGDLPEGFAVYSSCKNKYCVNPDHHYATTPRDYISILKFFGLFKERKGYKHKPETIKKMSQKQKGKKPNDETRYKMSLAKTGVRRNPEVVVIMSENSRGENNGHSKLTEQQVFKIRSSENSFSSDELAKIYPVSSSHIRSIWRKRCWKHLIE